MSDEKLYGHYEGLMDYDTYPDHVMAMTTEKLHGKSAAEPSLEKSNV